MLEAPEWVRIVAIAGGLALGVFVYSLLGQWPRLRQVVGVFGLALLIVWLVTRVLGCSPESPGDDQSAAAQPEARVWDDERPFGRIYYRDLTYLGAIRTPNSDAYAYCEGVIAYCDSRRTLVLVDRLDRFVEMTIPEPVISEDEDYYALREAQVIGQPSNCWEEHLEPLVTPATRLSGCVWFAGRFWITSYESYNAARRDNLGVTSMSEDFGDYRGGWRVGPSGVDVPIPELFHCNKTHDYVTVIPESWAARYTPGKRLAAGRHRQAGTLGSGNGPALYAFRDDAVSPAGSDLGGAVLVAFPFQDDMAAEYLWEGYRADDDYAVVWIESRRRQAVIVGARNGTGDTYYGVGLHCNSNKGYHSEPYEPRLYFLDVNHLGKVVRGKLQPFEVEPYESVCPMEVWRHPMKPGQDPTCPRDWFGDFAWDREGRRLFAVQPDAYRTTYSPRLVIHVWRVR